MNFNVELKYHDNGNYMILVSINSGFFLEKNRVVLQGLNFLIELVQERQQEVKYRKANLVK